MPRIRLLTISYHSFLASYLYTDMYLSFVRESGISWALNIVLLLIALKFVHLDRSSLCKSPVFAVFPVRFLVGNLQARGFREDGWFRFLFI